MDFERHQGLRSYKKQAWEQEKGRKTRPSEVDGKKGFMNHRKSSNEFSGAAGKTEVMEFVSQQNA